MKLNQPWSLPQRHTRAPPAAGHVMSPLPASGIMSGLSRHTVYSAMRRTCLLLSLLLSLNAMPVAADASHEGGHEGGHQVPPVPRIAHPHEETAAWWFHAGAEAAARNRGAAKPAAR